MSLPHFEKTKGTNEEFEPLYNYPIYPIYKNLFEVRSSDLPVEVSENICSYDIDIINKTISLELDDIVKDYTRKLVEHMNGTAGIF